MQIENTADQFIVIQAFRYAVGRQTSAVSGTVDWLLAHWDQLRPDVKAIIFKEIHQADARQGLGMDMDREEWLRLLHTVGPDLTGSARQVVVSALVRNGANCADYGL